MTLSLKYILCLRILRSCLLWVASARLWMIWPKPSSCSPQPVSTDTEEHCSSFQRFDRQMSFFNVHAHVAGRPASVCWPCARPSHQDYVAAMEDFQQSLELKKNQPIAMLYKGLTFFHRGMLKVSGSLLPTLEDLETIFSLNKPLNLGVWWCELSPNKITFQQIRVKIDNKIYITTQNKAPGVARTFYNSVTVRIFKV